MHTPREPHLTAAKRILRYLQGTLVYVMLLCRASTFKLIAYSNVDWAGCPDTCRSTSGYAVFLGDNLISWSSKRQTECRDRVPHRCQRHGEGILAPIGSN
jgi:hypothetical protein